ncbi:unnamed protein product [Larinioides sclopetarius]|uniref:Uncharacterized protein n=1 Tax=Larinioides sclopetarius TaxID=280406 RepID=A0AAV2B8R6_9ARAC
MHIYHLTQMKNLISVKYVRKHLQKSSVY